MFPLEHPYFERFKSHYLFDLCSFDEIKINEFVKFTLLSHCLKFDKIREPASNHTDLIALASD